MRIKRKKKLNLFAVLFSLILILLLGATLLYYNYNQIATGKTKISNVKVTLSKETELRTGPASSYPILESLSSGSILQKQSENNEWMEVRTEDNNVGWIPGWNVVGSSIKSPEEKMKEQLNKYYVIINPIKIDNINDYTLKISKNIKTELEKLNIGVFITRDENKSASKEEIYDIASKNNSCIINISLATDTQFYQGASIYYANSSSQILSKYLEKSLNNHYIMQTSVLQKNDYLVKPIIDKVPEILIFSGNIHSKVDMNVLQNEVTIYEQSFSISKGIIDYFYYLISIDNYNEKLKEQLVNMPQKGMNIPFYYTKQDEFKNIDYGLDNNKKISQNGDAIISLYMILDYLNYDNSITVSNIVDWAGNKYYISGQGTYYSIVSDFATKYNLKVESIQKDLTKIDQALKDNKPVLIQLNPGLFGNKVSYKVIRGIENNQYYINDPDDDDSKLHNYTAFSKSNIEKNLIQAWIFSK